MSKKKKRRRHISNKCDIQTLWSIHLSKGTMWGMKCFKTQWNHDTAFFLCWCICYWNRKLTWCISKAYPFCKITNRPQLHHCPWHDLIFDNLLKVVLVGGSFWLYRHLCSATGVFNIFLFALLECSVTCNVDIFCKVALKWYASWKALHK